MKFAREIYSAELWDEIAPLLERHYAETASSVYGPLKPDRMFYEKAWWMMRIFTIRQERRLVGYQIFFILGDPHSEGRTQAVQDVLYVERWARQGLTAYRFMKWCITQLTDVQVVIQRIPAGKGFGRILERMGFHLEDLSYALEV